MSVRSGLSVQSSGRIGALTIATDVQGGVMMIDAGGAAFLAAAVVRKFEGLSLAPYFCSAGKLTTGYGHVILPGEDWLRGPITRDDAEALLMRDLAWAMLAARSCGRALLEYEVAALASLIFNIGLKAWADSTIRKMIVAGDFAGAAGQFERFNKAGGRVIAGLVNRRALEARIFKGECHGLD